MTSLILNINLNVSVPGVIIRQHRSLKRDTLLVNPKPPTVRKVAANPLLFTETRQREDRVKPHNLFDIFLVRYF